MRCRAIRRRFSPDPPPTRTRSRRSGTALGLDRPLPEQFLHYVGDLLHGNLGNSLTTGQPVLTDLVERLPASLELSAFALLFAVGVAIPMGVWAATRINGPVDHACRGLVTVARRFRPSSSVCCSSMCSISCSAGRRSRSGG